MLCHVEPMLECCAVFMWVHSVWEHSILQSGAVLLSCLLATLMWMRYFHCSIQMYILFIIIKQVRCNFYKINNRGGLIY